jgi:protease-4
MTRSTPLLAMAGLALLLLGAPGCVTLNLLGGSRQPLEETVVYGSSGPKFLMVSVDGVINDAEEDALIGPGRESTLARLREQLDMARRSGDVAGLILRIDSPGGGATASELVYREVLAFKQEQGVPVVAQLMGTAASGGYYVAMAADEVVAAPTTVTGSIGVIFIGLNFSGLMQKLGIENQTITAGRYKDTGSPLRPMKPDERAQLQSILDDLHDRFQQVVDEGRPKLDAAAVAALADGRVFSATQALENGLVDRIATLEETVKALERRTGNDSSRVVVYHRPREWRSNLYTRSGFPEIRLDLGSLLGPLSRPGFAYLWWPGAE